MRSLRSRWLALGTTLLLAPLASLAATSPVKLTTKPTASVANSCVIKSLDTISLGAYSPITGLAVSGSGQLQLICTKGTAVSALPTTGGTQLSGPGGSKLAYGLYLDASASKLWGGPAVVNQTLNMYSSSALYFSTRATAASIGACSSLAKDTLFVYDKSSSGCAYGYTGNTYNPTTSPYGFSSASGGNGLSYYNNNSPQVIVNPQNASFATIYLPTGTSKVDSQNYTVVTSRNGTAALTGTSTTALSALTLPYYAKAPGGQDLVAGSYTDTVTVQVSF